MNAATDELLLELVGRARDHATTTIWFTRSDVAGRRLLDRLMALVDPEPDDKLLRSVGRLGFYHRDGGRVLFRDVLGSYRGHTADVVVLPTWLSARARDDLEPFLLHAEIRTWEEPR